jgi:hypothetical protein
MTMLGLDPSTLDIEEPDRRVIPIKESRQTGT